MNPDTDGLSDDEDGEQKDHSHLRTTLSNLQEAKKPEVKFQKYLKHEQEKMKYIELENEETMAQTKRIDTMIAFDITMKKLNEHCKKMLEVNPQDIYKHIERAVFATNVEPSALLKYYNDVLLTTKFVMPPRVKLEADKELFKKLIVKYRGAQKLEVRWVKKQAIEEAKIYIRKQFINTQSALKEECIKLINK